jgi:hypothetical protein
MQHALVEGTDSQAVGRSPVQKHVDVWLVCSEASRKLVRPNQSNIGSGFLFLLANHTPLQSDGTTLDRVSLSLASLQAAFAG